MSFEFDEDDFAAAATTGVSNDNWANFEDDDFVPAPTVAPTPAKPQTKSPPSAPQDILQCLNIKIQSASSKELKSIGRRQWMTSANNFKNAKVVTCPNCSCCSPESINRCISCGFLMNNENVYSETIPSSEAKAVLSNLVPYQPTRSVLRDAAARRNSCTQRPQRSPTPSFVPVQFPARPTPSPLSVPSIQEVPSMPKTELPKEEGSKSVQEPPKQQVTVLESPLKNVEIETPSIQADPMDIENPFAGFGEALPSISTPQTGSQDQSCLIDLMQSDPLPASSPTPPSSTLPFDLTSILMPVDSAGASNLDIPSASSMDLQFASPESAGSPESTFGLSKTPEEVDNVDPFSDSPAPQIDPFSDTPAQDPFSSVPEKDQDFFSTSNENIDPFSPDASGDPFSTAPNNYHSGSTSPSKDSNLLTEGDDAADLFQQKNSHDLFASHEDVFAASQEEMPGVFAVKEADQGPDLFSKEASPFDETSFTDAIPPSIEQQDLFPSSQDQQDFFSPSTEKQGDLFSTETQQEDDKFSTEKQGDLFSPSQDQQEDIFSTEKQQEDDIFSPEKQGDLFSPSQDQQEDIFSSEKQQEDDIFSPEKQGDLFSPSQDQQEDIFSSEKQQEDDIFSPEKQGDLFSPSQDQQEDIFSSEKQQEDDIFSPEKQGDLFSPSQDKQDDLFSSRKQDISLFEDDETSSPVEESKQEALSTAAAPASSGLNKSPDIFLPKNTEDSFQFNVTLLLAANKASSSPPESDLFTSEPTVPKASELFSVQSSERPSSSADIPIVPSPSSAFKTTLVPSKPTPQSEPTPLDNHTDPFAVFGSGISDNVTDGSFASVPTSSGDAPVEDINDDSIVPIQSEPASSQEDINKGEISSQSAPPAHSEDPFATQPQGGKKDLFSPTSPETSFDGLFASQEVLSSIESPNMFFSASLSDTPIGSFDDLFAKTDTTQSLAQPSSSPSDDFTDFAKPCVKHSDLSPEDFDYDAVPKSSSEQSTTDMFSSSTEATPVALFSQPQSSDTIHSSDITDTSQTATQNGSSNSLNQAATEPSTSAEQVGLEVSAADLNSFFPLPEKESTSAAPEVASDEDLFSSPVVPTGSPDLSKDSFNDLFAPKTAKTEEKQDLFPTALSDNVSSSITPESPGAFSCFSLTKPESPSSAITPPIGQAEGSDLFSAQKEAHPDPVTNLFSEPSADLFVPKPQTPRNIFSEVDVKAPFSVPSHPPSFHPQSSSIPPPNSADIFTQQSSDPFQTPAETQIPSQAIAPGPLDTFTVFAQPAVMSPPEPPVVAAAPKDPNNLFEDITFSPSTPAAPVAFDYATQDLDIFGTKEEVSKSSVDMFSGFGDLLAPTSSDSPNCNQQKAEQSQNDAFGDIEFTEPTAASSNTFDFDTVF